MLVLTCRNRVKDYATWKRVFTSHQPAHRAAGLFLRQLGQELDSPDQIFYTFEVESLDKAKAFINAPDAGEAAKTAGVIDGEFHFVEVTSDY